MPKGESVTIRSHEDGALTAYVTYPHWRPARAWGDGASLIAGRGRTSGHRRHLFGVRYVRVEPVPGIASHYDRETAPVREGI
jgi:hypothetical protein